MLRSIAAKRLSEQHGMILNEVRRSSPSASFAVRAVLLAWAAIGITSTSAFLAIAVRGPLGLASNQREWFVVYGISLAVLVLWLAAYAWAHGRLAASRSGGWAWLCIPVAVLSLSVFLDAAVLLAGKLPYAFRFDEEDFRAFRYMAGAILVAVLFSQDVLLLAAVRGGISPLATSAVRALGSLPGAISHLKPQKVRLSATAMLLVAVLAASSLLRLTTLDKYHYGDMDVMLSLTYNLLAFPFVHYYHNYVSQTWVYNHLPLFPMVLAPVYWLFENVLHIPTYLGAKLLIGVADCSIAILLYRQARTKTKLGGLLGVAFAALWMISSWAFVGDDHPVSFALAFGLFALASLDRPWLCGLLLALAVASRDEMVFFATPLLFHFATRRRVSDKVPFFGVLGLAIALIVLPFLLFDPGAMDYALRSQLQRDAATVSSFLYGAILPYVSPEVASFLRTSPSVMAVTLNLLAAMLAVREGRVSRVVLLVTVVYVATLPLTYPRYLIFAYGTGIFYASRYSNPLVALASLILIWPGFPYLPQLLAVLILVLTMLALAFPAKECG